VNVWLALSDTGHAHSASAWKWQEILPDDHKLIFSRYTQIGLLRLLTNVSVMGDQTLTLRKAWVFMTVGSKTRAWSCIPSRAT
jgi:predicted nucleic acid-binding protein